MKTFKSFIAEEKPNIKRKAKGEQDFVDAHEVEITDPTDQGNNSAKVTTKAGSGKHKNDRQDNKQEFGEDTGQADARKTTPSSKEAQQKVFDKHRERMKQLAKEEIDLEEETKTYMVKFEKNGKVSVKNYEAKSDLDARSKAKVDAKRMGMEVSAVRLKEEIELDEKMVNPGLEKLAAAKKRQQPSHTNPGLEALAKKKKSLREMRKSIQEADFSKQQTKMAHTIGKEFEKKGVGDESQGGPYAVASAMVRDKPEAAKKAYKTIQSKMKEEADAELLFNLYNDLNEENQEMFMSQLEEDAEALLEFAQRFLAD
jgi:hypothetical protein